MSFFRGDVGCWRCSGRALPGIFCKKRRIFVLFIDCVFLRFFKDALIEADIFSAPVDNTDTVSYPSFRKRGGGAQPGKRGGARPECSSLNRSGEAARALRARQASFPVLCCVCLLAGFLGFAPETAAQSTGNEVTIRVDVPKYVVEGKTDTVTVTMSGTRRPVTVHLDAITLNEGTTTAGLLNDKYVHTVVYPEGTFPIDYRDVDFPGGLYTFAKDSSSVQTFPLEAVDDGTSEPPELAAIRLYIRPANVWLCAHCTIDSATPADGWSDIWEEGGSGGPDGFYWFVPILNEAPDMVRSEDNMTITEGSSDTTYTVKLATHPIADVATVTLDVSDPMALTVDTDADTAGDQNTLSFTASNWNERQTVTITAEEDDDAHNHIVSVKHTLAGGIYDNLDAPPLIVTIEDADTAGVTITEPFGATKLSEPDGTDGYDVELNSQPAANVKISVQAKAGVTINKSGETAAASQELTFTSSNWNTAQTITVAAVDDDIDQPHGTRSAMIFHTASSDDDEYDGVSVRDVEAIIRDDDPTEVTLSTPDSTATEGSDSDTAEILLTLNRGLVAGETLKIPLEFLGGAVETDFTLSLKDSPGVSFLPSSTAVTFEKPETGASATSATLTLTALKDADAQDQTVTVSIPSASSGVSPALSVVNLPGGAVGSRTGSGRIVFTDDDEPVVSFASAASSTSEGSGEHDVTINLDPAPASNISLQYRFDFGGTATEDKDYMWPKGSGKSAPLAVSPEDATLPIPVEIIDDKVTEGDETMQVTILDGSGYIVGDQDTYTLTILDNDKGGVTVMPTSLSLTEGGDPKKYTVVLDTDPGDEVMVTPIAPDKGVVKVSGLLRFDSSNWATKQEMTVTPLDDADAHDETITIRHIVSGYVGVSQSREDDVTVRVTDDDKAGVTLSTPSLTVHEGGTEEYTVVLDTDPLAEVTVTPTSSDPGVVAVSCGGADPCALTFDSGNWDTPQPVTVTPADDADADNESVEITHAVSAYAGVPQGPDVAVVVDDDEVPVAAGVDANPLTVDLEEGSGMPKTYKLVLRTDPGGAVTVTPSSEDPGAATVSCSADPCALTFNSSNWSTEQEVTVTPVDDADANNESVKITHAVSGYPGVLPEEPVVIATVDDDEEPVPAGVEARPLTVEIKEGSGMPNTYELVLRTDPGVAVTVTPSSDDPGAATVSCSADPCALTFNSSNWSTAQEVTVTPADDEDTDNESVTIMHAVSGYAGVPQQGPDVKVMVEDDDEPAAGVSFASAESRVGEGAESVRVTVNLDPAPSAPISVQYAVAGTATAGDAGDVVIAGSGTVSVASGAASAAILITINDDDDRESDETVILTLRAGAGYDLGDPPHEHILTILDNDEDNVSGGGGSGGGSGGSSGGSDPSLITLSVSPNPVPEGETVMVTATLSQPLVRSAAIPLAIAAGTAEAEDYQALRAIEIAANEATGAGAISTAADADLDDETFTVSLGILPEGMAAGAQASVEVIIADATSIVSKESFESENEIPTSFALDQNYPNPFNPVTTIGFSLARAQHVRLVVYDLLGQEVRVLLDGVRTAARHRVSFDASDLASGTYLYVLRTEEETAVRTMALLK